MGWGGKGKGGWAPVWMPMWEKQPWGKGKGKGFWKGFGKGMDTSDSPSSDSSDSSASEPEKPKHGGKEQRDEATEGWKAMKQQWKEQWKQHQRETKDHWRAVKEEEKAAKKAERAARKESAKQAPAEEKAAMKAERAARRELAKQTRAERREQCARAAEGRQGAEPDFTFEVHVADGRHLTISWNRGDRPRQVALAFAAANQIGQDELGTIVDFIRQAEAACPGGAPAEASMAEPAEGETATEASEPAPSAPPAESVVDEVKLAQLESMGFANRELNAELLAAHNGDMRAVLENLIR
mmetsp:Transcript_84735/g.189295  ORF Transcript_84735/g.189295 Transcript_84735/m.189295 type:complete len:297 (-) Transcript_84735:306-1196(-)